MKAHFHEIKSRPSHGIENRRYVQRRGRSIPGQSSLKISGCSAAPGNRYPTVSAQKCASELAANPALLCRCCPTEAGAFDGPVFVPGGTTESSPALQCRVPASPSSRPGGTLEAPCTCALEGQALPRRNCRSLSAEASGTALQASLRDATPFHHQPGTEVPGYFQSSLPGRRRPRVPDVLRDGCEIKSDDSGREIMWRRHGRIRTL